MPRTRWGYLTAVLMTGLAGVLLWFIREGIDPAGYFAIFYPAIMAAAFVGGLGPGLFATLISATVGKLLISGPPQDWGGLGDPVTVVHLMLLVLIGALISLLSEGLHRARRRAELALATLEESENRLVTLFRADAFGVIIGDLDGPLIDANDAFLRLLGYTRQDLAGGLVSWRGLTAPESSAAAEEARRELRASGVIRPFRAELLRRDGARIDVVVGGLVQPGHPDRAICYVVDLTAQRTAEAAVRASERRFGAVFNQAAVGIVELDLTGQIIEANDRYAEIVGRSRDEVLGRRVSDLTHPDDIASNLVGIAQLVSGEIIAYQAEKRYRRPDGSTVWGSVSATRIVNARGEPISLVGIVEDVTARKVAEENLRQSREQLRLIANALPAVIAYIDRHLRYQFVNSSYSQWMGLSEQEVLNRRLPEVFDPERYQRVRPYIERAMAGETVRYEVQFPFRDGQMRWVETVYVPDLGADGQTRGIVVLSQDVSQRKRREEAERFLAEASRLLSSSLDYDVTLQRLARLSVPTLADWCAVDMLNADQSVHRLAVAHPDPAKEQMAWELSRRYPSVQRDRGVLHVLETGQPELYPDITDEMLVHSAQDAAHLKVIRDLNIRSAMIVPLVARGRTLGAITFVSAESGRRFDETDLDLAQDLARRAAMAVDNSRLFANAQNAARQAQEHAARLRGLTEAATHISASADLDAVIRTVTERARLLIGAHQAVTSMTRDENWAQSLTAVSMSEKYSQWEHYNEPTTGQGIYTVVCRTNRPMRLTQEQLLAHPAYRKFSRHDADHPPLNGWLAAPLIGRDGTNLGLIQLSDKLSGEFTEEDEVVLVQLAQLASGAIENARLYQDARDASDAAAAANRSKDEFLATVSHELRTPLNAILGWAQLLRTPDAVAPEEAARGLETIERNARAQAELIEDLLDISRIITGNLRLELREIDLEPVIRAAIDSVRPSADAKSIRIHPTLDGVAPLRGDPHRLQQVVWNLLSNAIKFTPAQGHIHVDLRRDDESVLISVRDTGEGIDTAFLPFVFDRFRQADGTATRKHGGLGLGLSIVRHLVQMHGGTVSVESQGIGHGATFTIRLPLHGPAPHAAQAPAPAAPAQAQRNGSPNLKGLRILIVDDEADTRELLARVLRHYKADVTSVGSAAEAIEVMRSQRPDLLLSDIGMPGEDGYSLIRRVRDLETQDDNPSLPAIALTAFARSDDRKRALAAGFDEHIAKPIDPSRLTAAIESLTRP